MSGLSDNNSNIEYNDLSDLPGTVPFNYEYEPFVLRQRQLAQVITQPLQINYEELYKTQLEKMEELGFRDREHNIICLRRAKGNLNNALSLLFDFE
tara:strand:+ start:59 stop:346 length:288 start_codon:yes stop_codon:yes gene_type:complete